MILYDSPSPAPNPRRVRIFAAEKGIDLPTQPVSLLAGEHKSAEHLARNPLGQTPVLVTDDDVAISETVAICRYLEALHPAPALFGATPLDIGIIEMWIRRAELTLGAHVRGYWINAHPFTAKLVAERFPDYGESKGRQAITSMTLFDTALSKTGFIAGDAVSMADIVLLTTIDFAAFTGLAIPADLTNLQRWHSEVSARPSASA